MTESFDFGPFTPSHCTVCRAEIPDVEDPSYRVKRWARHLNYMNHLKKYHPEYYKWSNRWMNSLYLPMIPFGVLATISAAERSTYLLLEAIMVGGISYVPLLLYRWRRVQEFREKWGLFGK